MSSLINRISTDLKLKDEYINSIVRRSNYYYKDYRIPKRNGGQRRISQASPELKTLQYWIKANILSLMPISKGAFAYNKGSSIKKHVSFHKDAYFIFHTDIKDFFPSITSKQLVDVLIANQGVLKTAGLWFDDITDVISSICFRHNHLCIGTVSSPAICNIIMYSFDEYFVDYCNSHNWKYSRYADDIYISSREYLPCSLRNEVNQKLQEIGFSSNDNKTWFCSKKSQRKITGLILTEKGRISVGLERRLAIKKMVYDRIVHGRGDPDVVLGNLAFLKDIEPNVYNSFLIKYAGYCEGDVIAAIKSGPNPNLIVKFDFPDI
ncbi:MAG: retron St85 family RNA-directed DNA polymerase [Firmicutes bacterium]|nr:retron St85 family RNA-directed DNA polymerase [Bacillota bacterium]